MAAEVPSQCCTQPDTTSAGGSRIELYWLPLGAGGHSVRWNGRAFEALAAARQGRPRRDLYHCALVVSTGPARYAIELAPSPDADGGARGVVKHGAVGAGWAGRWRWFRYEVRCWRDGVIPDADEAVASPVLVSTDPRTAHRILHLAPDVPDLVWGRDQAHAGEMWNSNSVIAWLLQRGGVDAARIDLPPGGRAPGWDAGITVARRSDSVESPAENPRARPTLPYR